MKLRSYLPEFVYGGIDGSITTFAVVTGAIGASLNPRIILILGFANLIADGFSMAVSNYLSSKSQIDLDKKINKNKSPFKAGTATFISFILIGIIPLISFILSIFFNHLIRYQFAISIILTAIAFVCVGAIKGIVVKKHPIKASVETLLIGGIAALLAYAVGFLLKSIA